MNTQTFGKIKKIFTPKKRKGYTMMEIMIVLIVIITLSAGIFFVYSNVQESRKTATMTQDMNTLALAAQAYESFNVNGQPPSSLDDLVSGLSASDSIDNTEHIFIQESRLGTNKGYLDPWGSSYEYDSTERKITCTTKNVSLKF